MAAQLTDPAFLGLAEGATAHWLDYGWIYAFAAAIGFGTTIAEALAHGRRPEGRRRLRRDDQALGPADRSRYRRRGGSRARRRPHRHRDSAPLPDHGRLCDRDRADDLCIAQHHSACLRFRRRHLVYRHRAAGRRPSVSALPPTCPAAARCSTASASSRLPASLPSSRCWAMPSCPAALEAARKRRSSGKGT